MSDLKNLNLTTSQAQDNMGLGNMSNPKNLDIIKF
jgi:hypothetical protein